MPDEPSTATKPADDAAGQFAFQADIEADASSNRQVVEGTVAAANEQEARSLLERMRLQVRKLQPAAAQTPTRRIGRDDFLFFNQQLADLVKAGLPLGDGLRLMCGDLRRGRLAQAVQKVADDMAAGKSLSEAMARHEKSFPPAYTQLVQAGLDNNALAATLANFGDHARQVGKIRQALREAAAYPLAIFAALLMVWCFIGWFIVPKLGAFAISAARLNRVIESDAQASAAAAQETAIVGVLHWLPFMAIGIVLAALLLAVLVQAINLSQKRLSLRDWAARWLPLAGPALKMALVAQWCDALRVAVEANTDLPRSLEFAASSVGSPMLQADTKDLINTLAQGREFTGWPGRLLPPSVPRVIVLGIRQNSLRATLRTLSRAYQRQAEYRTAVIPAVMTPLLLVLMAMSIGLTMFLLLDPLLTFLKGLGGG